MITCEEPEVPNGSYVVGYDLYIHSTIEYHCEEGYLLHGEPKHTCDKNGDWTGELPYCECKPLFFSSFSSYSPPDNFNDTSERAQLFVFSVVDCGKVVTVPNGSVDYVNGTTHLGSEIAYSCTKNYRLVGSPRRYCLDNGAWSDATPKCEGN